MKNVNSVMLAMCLVLGAGNALAQDSGMAKDTMGHDETTQAGKMHDGMKKNAMGHGAMKMDKMSKDSKSSHMMKKDDASQSTMRNDGSQH